jgi:hypothetical protein
MRRLLISLAAVLPLAGAAAVQADSFGGGSASGTQTNQVMVVGTIESVDPANGTFVADAFVVPQFDGGRGFGHPGGPSGGYGGGGFGFSGGFGFPGFGSTGGYGTTGRYGITGHTGATGYPGFPGFGGIGGFGGRIGLRADVRGHVLHAGVTSPTGPAGPIGSAGLQGPTTPTATQVTIKVDPTTTKLEVRGVSSPTISSLAKGDRFRATFTGSPGTSITTLTTAPALEVDAAPAPQRPSLYAFAGTVTGTTSSTVTVNLFGTYPSSLGAAGSSATFTVGSSTLVLGGATLFSQGGVSNIAKGDIVAGGLIGASGQTAAQVEAEPLMLLLDLPAGATGATIGATGNTGTSGASGLPGAGGLGFLKSEKAAALMRAEDLLGLRPATKSHKKHSSHKSHH